MYAYLQDEPDTTVLFLKKDLKRVSNYKILKLDRTEGTGSKEKNRLSLINLTQFLHSHLSPNNVLFIHFDRLELRIKKNRLENGLKKVNWSRWMLIFSCHPVDISPTIKPQKFLILG